MLLPSVPCTDTWPGREHTQGLTLSWENRGGFAGGSSYGLSAREAMILFRWPSRFTFNTCRETTVAVGFPALGTGQSFPFPSSSHLTEPAGYSPGGNVGRSLLQWQEIIYSHLLFQAPRGFSQCR